MSKWIIALASIIACCGSPNLFAEVTLPAIFGDHMVLQRQMKIPIWGNANPGQKITVNAAGQTQSATADDEGNWRVELDPLTTAEPIEVTIQGENTITFKDVLVGEVWLCSGQSNMGFSVKQSANAKQTIAAADHPTIRLFTVGRQTPDEPVETMEGEWQVCTPESVADFSAAGYFFATELQPHINQPIGLIDSSWGGTRAEAWMPRKTFEALDLPYEPYWTDEFLAPKPAPGAKRQPRPRPHNAPAALYNGMIAPFAGFPIRGALWYQGEANTAAAPQAEKYGDVLAAMITSWRQAWKQGDFPFLIVQLANFEDPVRVFPDVRAGQAQVARDLPNVGLAVTIDIGASNDIHPKDKLTVGKRLALTARKLTYGEDIVASGPVFGSMKIEGNRAVLTFDHASSGLTAKGDVVKGFEVAGDDGKFVSASAEIDGDRVIVTAPSVESPKVVRYGWDNDPTCTLYNAEGLPAVPFEARQ